VQCKAGTALASGQWQSHRAVEYRCQGDWWCHWNRAVVPYGGTSSASTMAEARAEFCCGDQRVNVRYWWESPLLCTEYDNNHCLVCLTTKLSDQSHASLYMLPPV
jgi:hypothetical protein